VQAGTFDIAGERRAVGRSEGSVSAERVWSYGDRVILDLAMPPRLTVPDPRIDAVRGCVAIERGPLVYCLEQAGQADGVTLDSVAVDAGSAPGLSIADDSDVLGVASIQIDGWDRPIGEMRSGWPYEDAASDDRSADEWKPISLVAVPYLTWANRQPGAMRVWIPADTSPTRPHASRLTGSRLPQPG
jgi:DUF1680 family protein